MDIFRYRGYVVAPSEDGTYDIYTREEWSYGKGYRYPEWNVGSPQEAKEFIDSSLDEGLQGSKSSRGKRVREGTEVADYLKEIESGDFWEARTEPSCTQRRLEDILIRVYDYLRAKGEGEEFISTLLPELISSGIEFGIKKEYFDAVKEKLSSEGLKESIMCRFNESTKTRRVKSK